MILRCTKPSLLVARRRRWASGPDPSPGDRRGRTRQQRRARFSWCAEQRRNPRRGGYSDRRFIHYAGGRAPRRHDPRPPDLGISVADGCRRRGDTQLAGARTAEPAAEFDAVGGEHLVSAVRPAVRCTAELWHTRAQQRLHSVAAPQIAGSGFDGRFGRGGIGIRQHGIQGRTGDPPEGAARPVGVKDRHLER